MHRNSQLIFERFVFPRLRLLAGMPRVLEVGVRRGRSWYLDQIRHFASARFCDLSNARPDKTGFVGMGGPHEISSADCSFDAVLAFQVLEHVPEPWDWFPELARVCAPGGMVVTISPVTWQLHKAPVDCWRVLPQGAEALHRRAGLETELAKLYALDDSGENNAAQFHPGSPIDLLAIGRKPE